MSKAATALASAGPRVLVVVAALATGLTALAILVAILNGDLDGSSVTLPSDPQAAVLRASSPPPFLPSAEADFPGLDWGAQETTAALADFSSSDTAEPRITEVICLGDATEDRTCRLRHACLDVATAALVFFAGDEPAVLTEVSRQDGSSRRVSLTGSPLFLSGSTRSSGLALAVRNGAVPSAQVAVWHDPPFALVNRSGPVEGLAVLEDLFPLWTLLTGWLGWTPRGGTASPGTAGILWWDHRRSVPGGSYGAASAAVAKWFPGVIETDLDSATPDAGRPLVCFRSLVAGVGSGSALRNAAAAFDPTRTFAEGPLRPHYASFVASHTAFARDVLTALGEPSKAAVQARLEAQRSLGDVLVLIRGRPGGPRELTNAEKLIAEMRHVCGGRAVRALSVDTLAPREVARALVRADLVLAVHGVGGASALLFMRPGTAFIDLLPPRATAAQPELLSLALRLGVRLFTAPVREADCAAGAPVLDQATYTADVDATRALAALVVGHEP